MPVSVAERYDQLRHRLTSEPRTWLITGVAGFIGSALLESLLGLEQTVVGLDNFSTGHQANLDDVADRSGLLVKNFRMMRGDIRNQDACREACAGVDYVLHQAALGSVPRSIDDPLTSAHVNVDGSLNVLLAARDAGVKRVVYASSSSVYGDSRSLPQCEESTGRPLSPYAATKVADELFAEVFQRTYELEVVGLRYFNVFGRRQDPGGPYAAVIPRWISNLIRGEPCRIFGDGETSRDFCYVDNAVQANLLAAADAPSGSTGQAYNIACGESTSLIQLFHLLRAGLSAYKPAVRSAEPVFEDFRPGDVQRSLADITRAAAKLGYEPTHRVREGMTATIEWYARAAGLGTPSTSATA
jgi:UDP-N-acetylglucosamine/UDP-N-acetyl-alpha-D-glucosaminouronate 4-epimerase